MSDEIARLMKETWTHYETCRCDACAALRRILAYILHQNEQIRALEARLEDAIRQNRAPKTQER